MARHANGHVRAREHHQWVQEAEAFLGALIDSYDGGSFEPVDVQLHELARAQQRRGVPCHAALARLYLLRDAAAPFLLDRCSSERTAVARLRRTEADLEEIGSRYCALLAPSLRNRSNSARPVWWIDRGRMGQLVPSAALTSREREVLREIAHGRSNEEIGRALFISSATVRTHMSSILKKLGLRRRTQAVLYALRNDIARLDDVVPDV